MNILNCNNESMLNEFVDIVMSFIVTGKVDSIFLEEKNLRDSSVGEPSVFLTIIENISLSLGDERRIKELIKKFEEKYSIKIVFSCYDTCNFGLFDLYSNHQDEYTYKFEPNCIPYCLQNRLYDRTGKYKVLQETYEKNVRRKPNKTVVSVLPIGEIKKRILARNDSELTS